MTNIKRTVVIAATALLLSTAAMAQDTTVKHAASDSITGVSQPVAQMRW